MALSSLPRSTCDWCRAGKRISAREGRTRSVSRGNTEPGWVEGGNVGRDVVLTLGASGREPVVSVSIYTEVSGRYRNTGNGRRFR